LDFTEMGDLGVEVAGSKPVDAYGLQLLTGDLVQAKPARPADIQRAHTVLTHPQT